MVNFIRGCMSMGMIVLSILLVLLLLFPASALDVPEGQAIPIDRVVDQLPVNNETVEEAKTSHYIFSDLRAQSENLVMVCSFSIENFIENSPEII